MKTILFLTIVAIQFQLLWTGFSNAPDWVRAYDEQGNRVQLVSSWKVVGEKFYWHVETPDKKYKWDLNFWETK